MLQDLFKIQTVKGSIDEDVNAEVFINSEHRLFGGHFPNLPIVPGVCQLFIVKEIVQSVLNKKLILKSSSQVKFLSMINPQSTPKINVVISGIKTNEEGNIQLDASILCGDLAVLKCKGIYCVA